MARRRGESLDGATPAVLATPPPGRVVQECGVGLVPVKIADDALAFAAPPLIRSGPVDDADLAVAPSRSSD